MPGIYGTTMPIRLAQEYLRDPTARQNLEDDIRGLRAALWNYNLDLPMGAEDDEEFVFARPNVSQKLIDLGYPESLVKSNKEGIRRWFEAARFRLRLDASVHGYVAGGDLHGNFVSVGSSIYYGTREKTLGWGTVINVHPNGKVLVEDKLTKTRFAYEGPIAKAPDS